jgi:predicted metal-dependent HD superfamily phosphohydrolase
MGEWHALWFSMLGTENGAVEIFDDIFERYTTERRYYHTLEHVSWGLRRIGEIAAQVPASSVNVQALKWAMFFHDAVMEGQPDDELKSAELASSTALTAGLSREFAESVARLILATAHDDPPTQIDECVMSDADISILGASSEHFDAYEDLIRKEWAHVSDDDFALGRARVMLRFADKPVIFCTEYGRQKWEQQARLNLARSLRKWRRS